jgi:uncharacterized protein (TIGR03000 family)
MSQLNHSFHCLLLFAMIPLSTAVVLLTTPTPIAAQPEQTYYDATGVWRYSNGRWYHYRTYIHGYNPSYYARPDRVLPHGVSPRHYVAYSDSTRDATARPAQSQPEALQAGAPIYVEIRVPADAVIWFDGIRTAQTGTLRYFVSPPVATTYEYRYEVYAQWTVDGRVVNQSHVITAAAGEHVTIAFPAPAPTKGP